MNLLERARDLLQGLAAPAPAQVQSYSVLCPEGHRLRGERTEGYQALRCPTCGEGIFILPKSPLPEPAAPAPSARPRGVVVAEPVLVEEGPVDLSEPPPAPGPADSEADVEIEWEDETEEGRAPKPSPLEKPKPASARKPAPATSRRPSIRRESAGRTGPAARRAAGANVASETSTPADSRAHPRDWARRHRNTLIVLAVALLVAGTIGFRGWRANHQELPQIAALGRTQGLAALDEGNFDKAHQLLSPARRAVDSLNGAVEGAEEIRHGAEEAAILTSLVPDRLEAILAEAGGYSDPAGWPARFATFYRHRSIVVTATVIAAPDSERHGHYDLDYRIFQDGGDGSRPRPTSRVGRIDLTAFRLLELAKTKVGDQVLFGARLDSFALDLDGGEWIVRLEPDSGVFMAHPRALQAIGWPSGAEPSEEDGP